MFRQTYEPKFFTINNSIFVLVKFLQQIHTALKINTKKMKLVFETNKSKDMISIFKIIKTKKTSNSSGRWLMQMYKIRVEIR